MLKLGERPDPAPGPGEVRVRVAYSGVNPLEEGAVGKVVVRIGA